MRKLTRRLILFLAGCVAVVLVACQAIPQVQAQALVPNSPTGFERSKQPAPHPADSPVTEPSAPAVELPPLPYDYAALEPYIDSETMRLHHDNHHVAYVESLNEALRQHPELQAQSVGDLLRDLDNVQEDIRNTVRNNGGGHLNHTLFWQSMAPNAGGDPTGALAEALVQAFGSFADFKQQFNEAGGDRFGSGWVWLVRNQAGQLQILTTPNQDSPIMEGLYPLMGNDVWEHAYYLQYQNRRDEYLENWWNVVDWAEISRRLAAVNVA